MKLPFVILFLVASACNLAANVSLPPIISDNMVLQGTKANVWGTAAPGEAVSVTFGKTTESAVAGSNGRWSVILTGLQTGDTGDLTVSGRNTLLVRNIIVGDVWLCAGQSNMDMTVGKSSWHPGVKNAEKEIADAKYPRLRMFTVFKKSSETPLVAVNGKWEICSPETVSRWSAVAYFYGRQLHQNLGMPVGLIQAAWGGSNATAWTPAEVLREDPEFKTAYYEPRQAELANFPALKEKYEKETLPAWQAAVEDAKRGGTPLPEKPKGPIGPGWCDTASALFNGMIFGLTQYSIKGAIWYQGETNGRNADDALRYRRLLPAMITAWRKAWGVGDYPFYLVQIANFKKQTPEPTDSYWADVREAQRLTAEMLPQTGLAVAIDLGEAGNVHPANKQEVVRRLALIAEHKTYGKEVIFSGPAFASVHYNAANARVTFHPDTIKGLSTSDGGNIKGFALAGADGKFAWANAKIEDDRSIVLSAPGILHPVAVRYAWANNPAVNLVNGAGLPAVPFRTDNWPQIESR